jgi:hypothetical protein
MLEPAGQLLAAGIHQLRIHLVVDETIHFQYSAAEIFSLAPDPFDQAVHIGLLIV